jgi:hypothetical protein
MVMTIKSFKLSELDVNLTDKIAFNVASEILEFDPNGKFILGGNYVLALAPLYEELIGSKCFALVHDDSSSILSNDDTIFINPNTAPDKVICEITNTVYKKNYTAVYFTFVIDGKSSFTKPVIRYDIKGLYFTKTSRVCGMISKPTDIYVRDKSEWNGSYEYYKNDTIDEMTAHTVIFKPFITDRNSVLKNITNN